MRESLRRTRDSNGSVVRIKVLKRAVLKALLLVGTTATAWLCVHVEPVETSPVDAALSQNNSAANTVIELVKEAYQREFGHRVDYPAIYNDASARNCRGEGHLASTAYIRDTDRASTLLSMYTTRDGREVTRRARSTVLAPAGTFRVLSVLVKHPQTIRADALRSWAAAQSNINREHAQFADRRRYAKPIIVFENTNVMLDAKEVRSPRTEEAVRAALERAGHSVAEGQVLMVIDIDPTSGAGGFAVKERNFINVGNYANWKQFLTVRDWAMVAATAYHHEFAHLWGWAHDWAPKVRRRRRVCALHCAAGALWLGGSRWRRPA
jgi:hypothetical protein